MQHHSTVFRSPSPTVATCPGFPLTVPPLPPSPSAFSETAQLMHSFINFQGQVLRLAQGDARLFNYVDNSIAYIAVGRDTVRREVLKRLILLGGLTSVLCRSVSHSGKRLQFFLHRRHIADKHTYWLHLQCCFSLSRTPLSGFHSYSVANRAGSMLRTMQGHSPFDISKFRSPSKHT